MRWAGEIEGEVGVSQQHRVEQGESLIGLAARYGLLPRKIWEDPANASLRAKRRDMNTLMPGDVLVIPARAKKKLAVKTGYKHIFVRKGIPAIFRLQVLGEDAPHAEVDYELVVDGERRIVGRTDTQGLLEEWVAPDSRVGELVLRGEDELRIRIEFGHMDPIEETAGVQKRLNHLGFDCGKADGVAGPRTEEALKAFQRESKLRETGELDAETVNKLGEQHDELT